MVYLGKHSVFLGEILHFVFFSVEVYKYEFGQCGWESILFDFYSAVLPKIVSWILKYPTTIVDLSVFLLELPIISLWNVKLSY